MVPELSCPEAGGIFVDQGLNPALTGGFLTSGPPGKFCIFFFSPNRGFPHSSVGKESACNAGDLGLTPGLGRSSREGKGSPLQDSGLENSMDYTIQRVAKSRTRLSDFTFFLIYGINSSVYCLCGEGNGTPLQSSCLENPMDGGAWKAAVHGVAEGWTRLSDFPFFLIYSTKSSVCCSW